MRQAENEDELWGIDEQLMRLIEYDVRSLIWAVAAKKGTKRPEPIDLPSDRAVRRIDSDKLAAAKAEVDMILAFNEQDTDSTEEEQECQPNSALPM
ncbi:MAG: hypothetical protein SOV20_08830 [Coriobacteriales bacterium]|nr:hypothetical protein [Coriobacteriaceae bacterium]MDY2723902.1 hypothetical protein [Coriobacteriales bacterium]